MQSQAKTSSQCDKFACSARSSKIMRSGGETLAVFPHFLILSPFLLLLPFPPSPPPLAGMGDFQPTIGLAVMAQYLAKDWGARRMPHWCAP
jgi:hypothetical protein